MSVRVKAVTLEISGGTERVNLRQYLVQHGLCGQLDPIEVDEKLLHEDNNHATLELTGAVLNINSEVLQSVDVVIWLYDKPADASPVQPGRKLTDARPYSELPVPAAEEATDPESGN